MAFSLQLAGFLTAYGFTQYPPQLQGNVVESMEPPGLALQQLDQAIFGRGSGTLEVVFNGCDVQRSRRLLRVLATRL